MNKKIYGKKKLEVTQTLVFSRCCLGMQKEKKWYARNKEIIYKQKSQNHHSHETLLQNFGLDTNFWVI